VALGAPAYLIDKSALARLRHPTVASTLAPLLRAGHIAITRILELEVLFSSRSHRDFEAVRTELRGYSSVPIHQSDFDRAVDVMGLLALRGHHRAAGLADLLQAAVAERNELTLLHYDADFELIAAVTGQSMQWVVPRGSVA
jgi:predicted nucleic acid-binding protein